MNEDKEQSKELYKFLYAKMIEFEKKAQELADFLELLPMDIAQLKHEVLNSN